MQDFSVLMSVYDKENPKWFAKSLDSIFNQTVLPSEVVIVKDGLLTQELDTAIEEYAQRYSEIKIVAFEKNRGLGKALHDGVKHCSYDIIARMDTDDISLPTRFEKQLMEFEKQPDLDVCSAWIDEFDGDTDNIVSARRLPETHEELYRFGMSRNPVNHPVCMFRKETAIRCGNYQDYPLFEDYYLWARMLVNGCRMYCVQESLLLFRMSPEMLKRRGGMAYAITEIKFQHTLHGLGYISYLCMLKNILIRFSTRLVPNSIRKIIYDLIRCRN